MAVKDTQYSFEDEVFFRLKSQRNGWMITAIISLTLAACCVGALIFMLPLKESIPFVVMVDKTTGEAEKIVQVRALQLSEQEAVLQAELVSYITDRETYDIADNKNRIQFVLDRSQGQAEAGIRSLWTSASPDYPPEVYGRNVRIIVTIKSVSLDQQDSVARIRFTKTREEIGQPNVERSFVATVGYRWEPRTERNLEKVWENPLGFTVTNYRVDAETLTR